MKEKNIMTKKKTNQVPLLYKCNKAGKFSFCSDCSHYYPHEFKEDDFNNKQTGCLPSVCSDGMKDIKVKCIKVKNKN